MSASRKWLKYEVTKLGPARGDVVVVRHPANLGVSDLARLQRQCGELGQALGVLIILLPPDMALEHLDEAGMRRHGWRRVRPSRLRAAWVWLRGQLLRLRRRVIVPKPEVA